MPPNAGEYRLTQEEIDELLHRPSSTRRAGPRSQRSREPFIPGPIPLAWLDAAAAAGADLQVTLRIWRLYRMRQRKYHGRVPVSLQKVANETGRSRQWVGSTVRRLHQAGLLSIYRRAGRQLAIEIPSSATWASSS
jgi:biotin operon repressor